jgi:dTMP kinase
MTKLRPFSDHPRGLFVSVDGPSGAGKSTIVRLLAQMLVADGEDVHVTAEPSNGPIGILCRELTEAVAGHALACLYAADRYHHVEHEIKPQLAQGKTVISDRYIPSGLVIQRFDGIDPAFLWQLNAEADRSCRRSAMTSGSASKITARSGEDPYVCLRKGSLRRLALHLAGLALRHRLPSRTPR